MKVRLLNKLSELLEKKQISKEVYDDLKERYYNYVTIIFLVGLLTGITIAVAML
jgi:cytochrome bd-type quinol oxidase subunit 1